MVRRRVALSALALVLGGLWWWAVLRLALVPGQAGLLEGTMAAGGWGLSLLPVHVASARTPRYAPRAPREWPRYAPGPTRAWPRRRSGAGPDPS
ncbi:hypothetical protein [Streptomyces sp. CB03234]|uniref:hypothetical protein n=1 Tax=Streptomyces sp. (strain CB03234) TaxID=1703937 RepID=UPI00093B4782|nr:hypothetical protein [Streptomyces sp. CB03234]